MQKLRVFTFSIFLVICLSCKSENTQTPSDANIHHEQTGETILPPSGNIMVTEFMADPGAVSDNDGEWLEIYNPGDQAVDLSGWTLKDNDSDTHTLSATNPLVIQPKSYLVLSRNTDSNTNGGVPAGYQYSDVNLANASDEIILLDATGTEVDRVVYDSSWGVVPGVSLGLKTLDLDNNVSVNWCIAAAGWSGSKGDWGTPGAENSCGASRPDAGLPSACPHSPTKTISFNESLCENIANGKKKITLRDGHRTDIKENEWAKLVCSTSKTTFEGLITLVRLTTWGEITEQEYSADGFSSQDEMMQALKQYYPNITLESKATVLGWDNTTPCN
ncbi:MAG: lamin tail domain-containing protein [Pseudomonadota bacterium]